MPPSKTKRNLQFRLTIEPLAGNGQPVPDVEPVVTQWGLNYATKWGESHLELGVRTLINDALARVERADNG